MLRFQQVIFVESPDGETITLPVEDLDTATIEDLKQMILEKVELPLNEQHLFEKDYDEELKDDDMLSDHAIYKNDTLHLKVGIACPFSQTPSLPPSLPPFR